MSRRTDEASGPAGGDPAAVPAADVRQDARVLVVVTDLFFLARIRETARLAGVPATFARSAEDVEAAMTAPPRFALLDLTASFDHARIFQALDAAGTAVLGFTTHALARQTRPWHARCRRVVTKETLTAELPALLREGVR